MKKTFVLFILTICSFSYAQETSTVKGQILDGELFNEPLLMASVSLKNTAITTHTNFRGNFEFNDIVPGSYEIIVQFLGYDAVELPITVTSGENVEILQTLHAKIFSLPSTAELTTIENESDNTTLKSSQKR